MISKFDDVGLIDLIVKTGINDAIVERLNGMDRSSIAETIENNVRKTIIQSHLSDPAFYAKMSELLQEIIRARREKAIEYEEYLAKVADIARQVVAGTADDAPEAVKKSPGLRAIYNVVKSDAVNASSVHDPGMEAANDPTLYLAETLHMQILKNRPHGWRGNQARERQVKKMMYDVVRDDALVELLFPIIKAQAEY